MRGVKSALAAKRTPENSLSKTQRLEGYVKSSEGTILFVTTRSLPFEIVPQGVFIWVISYFGGVSMSTESSWRQLVLD